MGLFDRFSKKSQPEEAGASQENKLNPEAWFWESFLTNEAKFRHQPRIVKRSSKDEPVTLSYIIEQLLNIPSSDIGSMLVVSCGASGSIEKTEVVDSQSDVSAFRPYDMLLYVDEEGRIVSRTDRNMVLIISYRPSNIVYDDIENKSDKSMLCRDGSIIMFFRGIGLMRETAYARVSVMIPSFSRVDDSLTCNSRNVPYTTSFVLGFDIVSPDGKLKRYDEIEQSLIRKSSAGEELSSEEKAVLEGSTYSKDLGYDFGYGRWLVSEKRFADALRFLTKVYERLKDAVVSDFDRIHELFAETCFNIGFCLNEMGQYDRAAYYLGLVRGDDKPKYITEYINALVNNGDPRALGTVRNYLSEYNEGKRPVDSEEAAQLYDFLARRLAYLYIEYKMWGQARGLLEKLKESPANHDFAVGELEYLDQITGCQS